MFGNWLNRSAPATLGQGSDHLVELVRRELPDADEATWFVVAAMVALLGAVAYADRDYSDAEERRVRDELQRVQGITAAGIDAICATLRSQILEVATVEIPHHCRALLEFADRDLRFEILRVLVEVAAADGSINMAETNVLRQLTQSLGLTQDDYLSLQARHREKLTVLGT